MVPDCLSRLSTFDWMDAIVGGVFLEGKEECRIILLVSTSFLRGSPRMACKTSEHVSLLTFDKSYCRPLSID
jgi:hypothetical protein